MAYALNVFIGNRGMQGYSEDSSKQFFIMFEKMMMYWAERIRNSGARIVRLVDNSSACVNHEKA